MPASKLLSMREAVARFVPDGASVCLNAAKVAAVAHEPFGAFPSPLQGCYGRHHDFYHRFHEESRTVEGNRDWLDRWIFRETATPASEELAIARDRDPDGFWTR